MPLQPVDISGGMVSGVDDLSSATSLVLNFEVDEAGVNRRRLTGVNISLPSGVGGNFALATTEVIGLFHWKNYLMAVTVDRKVYAINDAVPNHAHALSTASTATQLEGSVRQVTWVAGESHVYFAGGGRIQRWAPSLTHTEVVTNSPGSVTHIASLGQRLVANDSADPAVFKWSDIGEGAWTTWPAANVSAADARPDFVRAIYDNAVELYVFGDETLQVYGVGTDPTLPFELVSSITTGIAGPYAATRMDANFAFLDHHRRVVISDGRSVEPISAAIQKTLRDLPVAAVSKCWLWKEELGQCSKLGVNFLDGETNPATFVFHAVTQKCFMYNLSLKHWTERGGFVSPFPTGWQVNCYTYWPSQNLHLFGRIFGITSMVPAAVQGTVPCQRTTGWQDFGTAARKRSGRVRLVVRRGTALEGATPGAYELRVQNDDGPWTPYEQISIGGPDQYEHTRDVFFGGVFRRRRYDVRMTSSLEGMSLVALYDDVQELGA